MSDFDRFPGRLRNALRALTEYLSVDGKRPWSAAKIALSALAGVSIAVVVVTRPLTAPLPNTIAMADMTWPEVRSAIEHGYTTVIVPSGGIEQNGPQMVLGNTITSSASPPSASLPSSRIPWWRRSSHSYRRRLLPPTGNMQFPGTIGVTKRRLCRPAEGIARSLKSAGFKTICFIADHGQSQAPQNDVAARDAQWAKDRVTVVSVANYYADDPQTQYLLGQGETRASSAITLASPTPRAHGRIPAALTSAGLPTCRLPLRERRRAEIQ